MGRFGEKGGRCGADGWGYCIEVARLIAGFGERGVGLELRGRSAGYVVTVWFMRRTFLHPLEAC